MIIGIAIIGLLLFIVIYVISLYNSVKTSAVNVDNAFAGIETYLEERFDMLTKVIATANQESKREIEMQTNITALRQGIQNANTPEEKMEASLRVEQAMPGIQATFENYPDPKFNEGFRLAQRAMLVIEDKLSAARRNYNAQVTNYNKLIITFPAVIIANMLKFTEKKMFEATAHKRADIDVDELWSK